ncbi:MAG: thiamine pyrophosphate-dependent enzyme, partial [bacterium]
MIAELEDYAILVRKMMLDMYDDFGCLSGAFSSVELYVALYLSHLDLNLVSANDPARTRVLAKGTASMAFYATLSAAGIIDPERLKHYGTFSLPTLYRVDMTAVDATHYTLGPSLGTAVGIALASKLKGTPFDVICFMGDGELQEGVDQAAKSAVSFGLNNLTVVVDCNALQSYYPTTTGDPSMQEDANGRLTRQVEFWRACGWQVTEIDGHDLSMVMQAYSRMGKTNEPYIILARTIKGKGVQEIEGKMGYEHHMSVDELSRARQTYAKKSQAVRSPVKKISTIVKENRLSLLAVPQPEVQHRDMRKAFGEWIRMLKNGNIGRVYSIDSDCRNIFSSECTAEIVSPANYQSKHIFPGLNERLTLTIAKGLGYEGLFSVVGSRTNNLTDTSEEWHAICFDQLPVLLVGTRPGAIQADWFPLKCSFNDIEIMGRHGCSIYQPSNSEDLNWLLE